MIGRTRDTPVCKGLRADIRRFWPKHVRAGANGVRQPPDGLLHIATDVTQWRLRVAWYVALLWALVRTAESADTLQATPTSASQTASAGPVYVKLTELRGQVVWQGEPSDCHEPMKWLIQLPEQYGVTLSIHDVMMSKKANLAVYSGSDTDTWQKIRTFRDGYGGNYAPVLSHTNTLLIKLKRHCSYNHFNISYYGHLSATFPLIVNNSREERLTSSYDMYDCSDLPTVDIPHVIKCDMVQQCVGGEDEADCAYKQDGCGDWIPFGQHCLKFTFKYVSEFVSASIHETEPHRAEEACRDKHGAQLAVLPDDAIVNFVAGIVRQSGFRNVVVGLKKVKPVQPRLRHLYRYLWQWGDRGGPIAHEQLLIQRDGTMQGCAVLNVIPAVFCPVACSLQQFPPHGYVCMKNNPAQSPTTRSAKVKVVSSPTIPNATTLPHGFPTKVCGDGSLVQTFHSCHWPHLHPSAGHLVDVTVSALPMFQCRYGQSVHYTLVCDGKADCADGSDEVSCERLNLIPTFQEIFVCRRFQVIAAQLRCNGVTDCFDQSDEEDCGACQGSSILCSWGNCIPEKYVQFQYFYNECPSVPPAVEPYERHLNLPAYVELDGKGMSVLRANSSCPEGYFRCNNDLCIPVFMLNNGKQDCLLGEDEGIPLENFTCPGYYRCQNYGNCVHSKFVCDGVYHCPNYDDEQYCNLPCPESCVCEGLAFTCRQMIQPREHPFLRYLDVSGTSAPSLAEVQVMELLQFLNLSACSLTNVTLSHMAQLQILDLSFNGLTGLSSVGLDGLSGLASLNLSGNPFLKVLDNSFRAFLRASGLSSLRSLTMTDTELTSIADRVLEPLLSLARLDIRDNPVVTFGKDVFYGLEQLDVLYTDNPKLCCSYFHGDNTPPDCYAPRDELSSCSDLLRHDFFRVFLWTFSLLAMAGNAGVMIYWICFDTQKLSRSYGVLVTSLCGADFLMGVYMLVIGAADSHFHGVYVSREMEWRASSSCKAAGFLAFVSSEVSAFLICLVTLDRVLVLCFPLKVGIHLKAHSALASSIAAWIAGLIMAAVPLMAQWEFYGQSGICLPLPITRREFSGQQYAFGVFIVLNFVLFLFIGVGQVLIMRSIRTAGRQARSTRHQQDTAIARRLFLIVLTDFCCWFPIGLMGLLAYRGVPIPSVVNVWSAIFVLPLNSALNPFLYTINAWARRWERRRMEARAKRVMSSLHTEIPKWSEQSIQELTRVCVRTGAVNKEWFLQLFGVRPEALKPAACLPTSGMHDVLSVSRKITSVDKSTTRR